MSELDDRLLGSIAFRADHGLIIVESPESTYAHDEWDPGVEFVSIGSDSLYLSVQPSVDGPINLVIAKSEVDFTEGGHVYFDGALNIEGSYVIVRDADDVVRFSVRCRSGENRIRVVVDEPGLARFMAIMVLSN